MIATSRNPASAPIERLPPWRISFTSGDLGAGPGLGLERFDPLLQRAPRLLELAMQLPGAITP
jgi:hypothetical protein